jgi:hypothetical protein
MQEFVKSNGEGAITFLKRGCDIREADYIGDIGNHRITAAIELEGVKIFIEARSVATVRSTSLNGKRELKTPIQTSSSNGIIIEGYAIYSAPLKSCAGAWRMFEEEKQIFTRYTRDIWQVCTHTKKYLLATINAELRTEFTDIILAD